MPVKLTLRGLSQLTADLRRLPEQLRDEGRQIAQGHLDDAESTIRSRYAAMSETGTLASGLGQRQLTAAGQAARFGVKLRLENKAPHAYLVEVGTELPRQTDKGWNRGRMPAAKVFLPTVIRARRAMTADLVALLERAGLRVRGG
jgi:hypothetical protein